MIPFFLQLCTLVIGSSLTPVQTNEMILMNIFLTCTCFPLIPTGIILKAAFHNKRIFQWYLYALLIKTCPLCLQRNHQQVWLFLCVLKCLCLEHLNKWVFIINNWFWFWSVLSDGLGTRGQEISWPLFLWLLSENISLMQFSHYPGCAIDIPGSFLWDSITPGCSGKCSSFWLEILWSHEEVGSIFQQWVRGIRMFFYCIT